MIAKPWIGGGLSPTQSKHQELFAKIDLLNLHPQLR
jgi:hypothetical protein